MYPIITESKPVSGQELGNNQKHYDIFGVRLVCDKNIVDFLEQTGQTSFLTCSNRPILKRVLDENERPSIFSESSLVQLPFISKDMTELDIIPERLDKSFKLSFASLYPQGASYSGLYDEILDIAAKYFVTEESGLLRSICISKALATYIKVFSDLGFSLQRGTKTKTIIGSAIFDPNWHGSKISTLFANTMAMMLLSGKTAYIDGGIEVPIILGGTTRTKVEWEDGTVKVPKKEKRGYYYEPKNLTLKPKNSKN